MHLFVYAVILEVDQSSRITPMHPSQGKDIPNAKKNGAQVHDIMCSNDISQSTIDNVFYFTIYNNKVSGMS